MKMWNPRKSDVRLIFLVTFVIFLCYTSVTDTAAVPFKMSKMELENLKLRLQSSTFPWKYYNRVAVRLPRATKNSDEENVPKHCHIMACGWGVYDSYTRNILYYMRNTCECPDKSYKCMRVGDDLSASAYVYRCRQNTTDGLEFPPTEEDVN